MWDTVRSLLPWANENEIRALVQRSTLVLLGGGQKTMKNETNQWNFLRKFSPLEKIPLVDSTYRQVTSPLGDEFLPLQNHLRFDLAKTAFTFHKESLF